MSRSDDMPDGVHIQSTGDGPIVLPESFAFVMNVNRFLSNEPHLLSTGHVFRRATLNEIDMIDRKVAELSACPHNQTLQRFWRRRLPWPGSPDELLPPDEWRYYVIAFTGPEDHIIDLLQAASDISTKELEIGFTIRYEISEGEVGHFTRFMPARYFQVLRYTDWNSEFFIDVEPSDLDMISSAYTHMIAQDPLLHDTAFDIKSRALGDINELKSLPYGSRMQYLGYFGILESLLTHKPERTDPYDSITRQVKKKIALLDGRWNPKLDYTAFGGAKAEKIWNALYDLRSKIAHGDRVAFDSEMKRLRDFRTAFMFLKQAVKAVLRFACTDARLLIDLREC